MYELLLFLHVLAAIFAVGPLVHLVTTAARGLRTGDAVLTAAAARGAKLYADVSTIVVLLGFGLMSMDSPYEEGEKVASFTETWIWLSALLWLVAVGVTHAVVVPTLKKAGVSLGAGESAEGQAGKVAAAGGVVALLFVVIVFLMVYQPGA